MRLVLLLQVDVRLLLRQFDVQEDDDASDIIDNIILFLLPFEVGLAHHGLGGFLRVFALVVRQHDLGDVVVAEELPNAVTCQDDKPVFGTQI